MRRLVGAALSALVVAGVAQPARGQIGTTAACPTCRAIAHFRSCEKPLDGGLAVFEARAIKAENRACSLLLSLDVLRAAELGLPTHIQVDLGPCAIWAGKTGDVIKMAVRPRVTDKNVYALGCSLW
jgi:hypothetical protein